MTTAAATAAAAAAAVGAAPAAASHTHQHRRSHTGTLESYLPTGNEGGVKSRPAAAADPTLALADSLKPTLSTSLICKNLRKKV